MLCFYQYVIRDLSSTYFVSFLPTPRIPPHTTGHEASGRLLLGVRGWPSAGGGRRGAGEEDEAATCAQVAIGGGGGRVAPADRVEETVTTCYETTRLDHPITQKNLHFLQNYNRKSMKCNQ